MWHPSELSYTGAGTRTRLITIIGAVIGVVGSETALK